MKVRPRAVLLAVLALTGCDRVVQERGGDTLRVLSLDQCADQYVLALGEGHDLALSPRADDPDSWLRDAAFGHRQVRPTLEAVLAFSPDVVVRYWGGDARLLAELERRGVTVVTLPDVSEYEAVEALVQSVAEALDREDRGEALIAEMRENLARGAAGEGTVSALYLTSGGFTTGPGTLFDATLGAAGLANAADHAGFGPVRVERLVLDPPERFVLGFYDQKRGDLRGAGRHPVVRSMIADAPHVALPAAMLTCPAWFVAEAVPQLANLRDVS